MDLAKLIVNAASGAESESKGGSDDLSVQVAADIRKALEQKDDKALSSSLRALLRSMKD